MFDSYRPHGLYAVRLLCPWDSPGKNTGVCCHTLFQGICPNLGSKPSLMSPALASRFSSTSAIWKAHFNVTLSLCFSNIYLKKMYYWFFFFFWEKFLVRKISYVFSLADFFVVVVLTLEWSLTSLKILGSALWRCHSFIFLHPALLLSLWSVSGFPLEMTCFIFLWQ